MRKALTTALVPPVSACRYACGTSCAAPITVFWLFGVVSVVFGLLGGPTSDPGISWATVSLGFFMWGVASVWTALTMSGVEADRCHTLWSPRDHHVQPDEREPDPLEEIRKAH